MYKLMAYAEEWIAIHERWNPERRHLPYTMDFSTEGWQNGVVVRHVLFRASEVAGHRDQFIVLACDGLDTLDLVEISLWRRCADHLSALLIPNSSIDEATAIHSIRVECQKTDRLLLDAPGPPVSTPASRGGRLVAYLSAGVSILAVAFGGYRHVHGQLEDVVGKSAALYDMVEQVLNKLSGKDAREGFLERLDSVEKGDYAGKCRSPRGAFGALVYFRISRRYGHGSSSPGRSRAPSEGASALSYIIPRNRSC